MGGIRGKKVELVEYDDEANREVGRQQARKIAEDNRILLALGSYLSSVSIQAGEVFQDYGLPAITAISEAKEVTENNNVYFRATFNTKEQRALLANYIKQILQKNKVTVIFDGSDDYSSALNESFQNHFQGVNGQLSQTLNIKNYKQDANFYPLAFVNNEILGDKPEEIASVVLLTTAQESAQIVANLKRSGIDAPIIGGTPLFEKAFRDKIQGYPEAKTQPGYFSDGIYATKFLGST